MRARIVHIIQLSYHFFHHKTHKKCPDAFLFPYDKFVFSYLIVWTFSKLMELFLV